MAIEIIDILKQKNNGKFPIVDSNDVKGGYYHVDTVDEMYEIPVQRRKIGMTCYCLDVNTSFRLLDGLENDNWVKDKLNNSNGIHVGSEPPEDFEMVWLDEMDEEPEEEHFGSDLIQEIFDTLSKHDKDITEILFMLDGVMDGGDFDYPLDEIRKTFDGGAF